MERYEEIHGIPEGLSSADVKRLTAEGKSNISKEKTGKSYLKIIADNVFTFFNLIWAIITVVLILCKSYENLTFLVVVVLNTLIAVVQEIKAKSTVERLSVTTDPRASVIRDGELKAVNSTEIVLGDVMLIELGKQVLSDAVVISGVAEANESMLTGESDAIKKQTGDKLLAGSFLVSGSVYAKVIRVGKDNYIHKIEKEAKAYKAPSSNLFRDLNSLIKAISYVMVPLALLVLLCNYITYRNFVEAVIKTCGSLTSMIPAGVYLLVTMTLTMSVIKLSTKKTLVQDMYSIEMLASADVVCLDKTGTITDGTMQVASFDILDGTSEEDFRKIMASIEGCEQSLNNTSQALVDFFGKDVSDKTIINQIPFSSARKYSAVAIEGMGGFSIGAPHFVPCPVSQKMDEMIADYAAEGKRVLLVARHENIENEGVPLALISINDRIRESAAETIKKFQDQGVRVKVISGDHAETVSTIARKVGIIDADKYLSCDSISDTELIEAAEKYAIFGRVTPEQKVLLIKTLKANGHTVAMTGDGVNDTLALKESNCAIAMADGSEVARKVAQIVLLDSNFSTLPDVVREGRRCINNVRQSAVLFLMKTLFTIFVSLFAVATFSGYPFEPNQTFLLELFIIGFASFALAFEPNNKRIVGSFLEKVITRSLPNALAMFIPVLALMVLEKISGIQLSLETRNSIAMSVIIAVGFINLVALCRPFTKWRAAVVGIVAVGIGTVIPVSILYFNDMFKFKPVMSNTVVFIVMLSVGIVWAVIMQIFRSRIERALERRFKKKPLNFDNIGRGFESIGKKKK